MICKDHIKEIIEKKLSNTGDFLVDIIIKPTNKILVEIDSLNGITIEKCVEYSREIEKKLDRDIEDFELTVSSPGLDKPFKVIEQYLKNIGNLVRIITKEGKQIDGKIKNAKNEFVEIEITHKQKDKSISSIINKIEYNNIKTTKAILNF